MTVRTILVIALALVFGVAASVYAINAVSHNREAANPDRVGIVIALRAVPRGTALEPSMLAIKKVAREDKPSDALEDINKAVGRVVEKDLVEDDPVLERKLAKDGVKAGLAPLIREGMQAFVIMTPTASAGVGGFIRPGDKVDVLVTKEHFHANDKGGTVRLLQIIEVLAVDTRMDVAPPMVEGKIVEQRESRFVTLLVTPEDAQKLALAQKDGTLSLVLRNPQDTTHLPSKVVTSDDLPYPSAPEEKKPDSPPPKVDPPAPPPLPRIIRGGNDSSAPNH